MPAISTTQTIDAVVPVMFFFNNVVVPEEKVRVNECGIGTKKRGRLHDEPSSRSTVRDRPWHPKSTISRYSRLTMRL
jgi:hypothetical protein